MVYANYCTPYSKGPLLWQPLITKTNDYTSSKSLRMDIEWEFHKETQQGVSA